jgi:hypothetical protein
VRRTLPPPAFMVVHKTRHELALPVIPVYCRLLVFVPEPWVFRYRDGGRLREMGLGPTHTVSLAEAREAALLCRKQRLGGLDPIEARQSSRAAARLDAAKAMTFRQCAEAYIARTSRAGKTTSTQHSGQRRLRPMRIRSLGTCRCRSDPRRASGVCLSRLP